MNTTGVNLSAPTFSVLSADDYLTLDLVCLLIVNPAEVFLTVLVFTAVVRSKVFKASIPQRNIHLCILLSGLLMSIASGTLTLSWILVVKGKEEVGIAFCKVGYYFIHIGFSMGNVLLANLAVTIHIIITKGVHRIKVLHLNIAMLVLWMVAFVVPIPYFISHFYNFNEIFDGAICFAQFHTLGYIHGIGSAIATDATSRIISIGVIIATAVHVKRNTYTDGEVLSKAVVKFTGLLLLQNLVGLTLSTVGYIPIIGYAHIRLPSQVIVALRYLNLYFSLRVPIIVPPLLMIAVYKPIMKTICFCTTPANPKSKEMSSNSKLAVQLLDFQSKDSY